MPPTPGFGGIVEVLDVFLLALFFLGLSRFGSGAGGASGFVVTPPPGARGGGNERAEREGQGESGKRSLHVFTLRVFSMGASWRDTVPAYYGAKRERVERNEGNVLASSGARIDAAKKMSARTNGAPNTCKFGERYHTGSDEISNRRCAYGGGHCSGLRSAGGPRRGIAVHGEGICERGQRGAVGGVVSGHGPAARRCEV